ncbi:Translocation protein S66 [Exophiala xenobiotica]|uniref:Translocation protein S66 n=1 Tax=Vermiconidia calcicola TaxID=1690605 RepID=A0AAV9QP32_9PEZI|nr:Translocation protein S66 [Exophiala xenobiotica]KAK5545757.1 Translocation protein S66 [Vermiconidia calcicola]KAK5549982.1 Translocation protein S66 [Chaetothyriales sp. CCFEE 6169]KAK5308222.1 Translocation protein S66 [Exophiala xenobiotica]KAK5342882.1 Translocation protein S66 [Exophiala xenobiotica]
MQFLSLLGPIAYLGILIGSMATFSHLYRQRQINSKLRLAPYFSAHAARNIYLSLLHMSDSDSNGGGGGGVKVPDSVLRAALLARAVEDVQRVMEVRTRKQPLAQLLQRGVVGDEIFQRLTRAEQELEIEIKDVMNEANALAPQWGNHIFQSANEMVNNKMLRDKLDVVKASLPAEKERWDAQRETARRELEGEGSVSSVSRQGGQGKTQTQTQTQAQAVETQPVPEKTIKAAASSDEDGVIVESPAVEVPTVTGAGGGGGGKSKKKKGKK